MTLNTRVQDMERRAGAADKDPAEMTLGELYEATLQEAKRHPHSETLQSTPDALAVVLGKSGATS